MIIEKIENGFLLIESFPSTKKQFFANTQDLFTRLLSLLENRSHWFGGSSYGFVAVFDRPGETITSPEEVEPA